MTCIAKRSQDLKCSVPSSQYRWLVCDCDISWSYSLFSKHSFFKPDEILLMAKRVRTCRINIFQLK